MSSSTKIEGKDFYKETDEFDGVTITRLRADLLEEYPRDETLKKGVVFLVGAKESKELDPHYRLKAGDRVAFRLTMSDRLDNAKNVMKVARKDILRRVPVRDIPIRAFRVRDEHGEISAKTMTDKEAMVEAVHQERLMRNDTTRRGPKKGRHQGRSFKKKNKDKLAAVKAFRKEIIRKEATRSKIPSGVAAWAIDLKHGDKKNGLRFCALHVALFGEPFPWSRHFSCASTGSKPNAAYLMMRRHRPKKVKAAPKKKAKRTSNVVHYCSKHGRYEGFAWNGHRRLCKAKEGVPPLIGQEAAVTSAKQQKALPAKPARMYKDAADVMSGIHERFQKSEGEIARLKAAWNKINEEVVELEGKLAKKKEERDAVNGVFQTASGEYNKMVRSVAGLLMEAK